MQKIYKKWFQEKWKNISNFERVTLFKGTHHFLIGINLH